MEKQNFLMEVMEITNGKESKEFDIILQALIKEVICTNARNNNRQINIQKDQFYINLAGLGNVMIGNEVVTRLIEFLREEGFEITEQNNASYYTVQW